MQPVNTWNMCIPVMPKNVAPNNGVEPGHFSLHSAGNWKGLNPSSIRCRHSNKCRIIKVAPNAAVARIHFRTFERSPREDADTAITMVRLEESSTSVMIEEKMMLGENLNGVGQTLDARTYA